MIRGGRIMQWHKPSTRRLGSFRVPPRPGHERCLAGHHGEVLQIGVLSHDPAGDVEGGLFGGCQIGGGNEEAQRRPFRCIQMDGNVLYAVATFQEWREDAGRDGRWSCAGRSSKTDVN